MDNWTTMEDSTTGFHPETTTTMSTPVEVTSTSILTSTLNNNSETMDIANQGNEIIQAKDDDDQTEIIAWAVGCTTFSLLIFAFATYQYLRKIRNSPAAKKKKKLDQFRKQLEREEKAIAEAKEQGPIAVEEFLKQLKKRKKKKWLDIEFKTILQFSATLASEVGQKLIHKKKNTYPNILPYDHSRVILECLPNDLNSDYINASYINTPEKQKAYIAAQGPNRHTVGDFWRMIWQENVHCIVMASNLFEHARQQCEKYWHNQHGRYSGIDVWLDETDVLANFTVRTFRVCRTEDMENTRIIKQFQFNGWSDHDVPNPTSVLEFRRKINIFAHDKPGPLLVHCSNGSGRTGAFIAIDSMLELLNTTKHAAIDLLNFVLTLRDYRPCLVRTAQQYEFVYDTIAMHIQCGLTVIKVEDLPTVIQRLSLKDQHTKLTGFEQQLKTLEAIVPKLSVGECAGGHRAENRRKSRDIMMQPPERARPYLMTHDSNDSTDYINACYIDGYRNPNAYIVTQWPMKSTINDIWRLVFDYNIPTMVVLNDQPSSRSYPRFWPTARGKQMPYGPLTIEFIEETEASHVTSRLFKVRKSVKYQDIGSHLADMTEIMTLVSLHTNSEQNESAKLLRIFHLRSWANNHRMPHNPSSLVQLLSQVEQWQQQQGLLRMPTLLVSRNGVSRVGTYCTISHCWDKMKAEGEVDVFVAAKAVKTNRPPLMDNLIDYMYCHTFLMMLTEIVKASPCRLSLPVNRVANEETVSLTSHRNKETEPQPRDVYSKSGTSANFNDSNENKVTIDINEKTIKYGKSINKAEGALNLTVPTECKLTEYIDEKSTIPLQMVHKNNEQNAGYLTDAPKIFITEFNNFEYIDASPVDPSQQKWPSKSAPTHEQGPKAQPREYMVEMSELKAKSTISTDLPTKQAATASVITKRSVGNFVQRVPTPHPTLTNARDGSLESNQSTSGLVSCSDSELPATEEETNAEESPLASEGMKTWSLFTASMNMHRLVRPQISKESSSDTNSDFGTVKLRVPLKHTSRRIKKKTCLVEKSSEIKHSVLTQENSSSCYETCSPSGSSLSSDWFTASDARQPGATSDMELPLKDIARPRTSIAKQSSNDSNPYRDDVQNMTVQKFKPIKLVKTDIPSFGTFFKNSRAPSQQPTPFSNAHNSQSVLPTVKYEPLLPCEYSVESVETEYSTADEGIEVLPVDNCEEDGESLCFMNEQDFRKARSTEQIKETPVKFEPHKEYLLPSPASRTYLQESKRSRTDNKQLKGSSSLRKKFTKTESQRSILYNACAIDTEDNAYFHGAISSPEYLRGEASDLDLNLVGIVSHEEIADLLRSDLSQEQASQAITREDLEQVAGILNELDHSLLEHNESIHTPTLEHQNSDPLSAISATETCTSHGRHLTCNFLQNRSLSTDNKPSYGAAASFDSGFLTNSNISIHSSPSRGFELEPPILKTLDEVPVLEQSHSRSVAINIDDVPTPKTNSPVSVDNPSASQYKVTAEIRRAQFRSSPAQSPLDEENLNDTAVGCQQCEETLVSDDANKVIVTAEVHAQNEKAASTSDSVIETG